MMRQFLRTSAQSEAKPLVHFWSFCVGAGRANEGLRANWLDHLRLAVKECGFQYIRFHGIFHDDMFVYRKQNGREVYNWQYLDELFDRLLAIGIRPFVELGFTPSDMASGTATQFWWKGNTTPPRDFGKWAGLVDKAARHWIDRYGLAEVRRWYFEVWNEPDLEAFWHGTKSRYFELYRVTVRALKAVDAGLRVGGPATSNFVPDDRFAGETEDPAKQMTFRDRNIDAAQWRAVWVEDFLKFCAREKLPLDFISTHPYPTDFALDGHGEYRGLSRNVNATRDDLKWLRDLVDRSPYPNAEIHLTEWNSSPSPRDHSHDYLPAAAYVVKANIESSGLVDSLSYWTFTDVFEESGAGDSIFHGGFGMINFQGVVKPTFHAYRFLNLLGDEELTRGNGWIATRHSHSGKLSLLAYNYPEEVSSTVPMAANPEAAEAIQAKGSPMGFSVELYDLQSGARFIVETVDDKHGFAIPMWRAMGRPEPPAREEAERLREAAFATRKEYFTADGGKLSLRLELAPWSIVSIREE